VRRPLDQLNFTWQRGLAVVRKEHSAKTDTMWIRTSLLYSSYLTSLKFTQHILYVVPSFHFSLLSAALIYFCQFLSFQNFIWTCCPCLVTKWRKLIFCLLFKVPTLWEPSSYSFQTKGFSLACHLLNLLGLMPDFRFSRQWRFKSRSSEIVTPCSDVAGYQRFRGISPWRSR